MKNIDTALKNIAEEFCEFLINKGFSAEIGALKGYGKKIKIIHEACGGPVNAVIYYKPTKGTYTFTIENKEKSPELAETLTELWQSFNYSEATKQEKTAEAAQENGSCHIYVDGSYIDGTVGYGMVALKDGKVVRELYGPVRRSSLISSRQVGGEITAVIRAIQWCKEEKIKNVIIHHDFENLAKWVDGTYKTRTDMTAGYKDFIRKSGVKITWVKVAAHTGNKYNERADELARKGAKSPGGDDF